MAKTVKNNWKCTVCNKYYFESHAKSKEYTCCEQKMRNMFDAERHMRHHKR